MGRMMAWVYDRVMQPTEVACLHDWRGGLLEDVGGEVLEIGAGTGVNLAHYPPALRRVVLTEPDPYMRRLLAARVVALGVDHEVHAASAEDLPFASTSFDWVISTLVLCSVRDPSLALSEIRRVLRPGGRLVFLEHVAAPPDSDRLRWQQRIEPVWRWAANNCHLTRDTEATLRDAGFEIETIARESLRKALPVVRPSIRGVARRSG